MVDIERCLQKKSLNLIDRIIQEKEEEAWPGAAAAGVGVVAGVDVDVVGVVAAVIVEIEDLDNVVVDVVQDKIDLVVGKDYNILRKNIDFRPLASW